MHDYTKPYKRRRKQKRAGRFLCFLAGLIIMLSCVCGSVVFNVVRYDLFSNAMTEQIAQKGILTYEDTDTFAHDTIAYLRGEIDTWPPEVIYNGNTLNVLDAFVEHMAQIKQWISFLKIAVPITAVFGLIILLIASYVARSKGTARHIALRWYYIGALIPFVITLSLVAWAVIDFNAMWAWLHHTFIPGGIFSATSAIMMLFPQDIFFSYIPAVVITFIAFTIATIAVPLFTIKHARHYNDY